MGAEEGPRAPNEPPTPQPRTKEILSLMAFLFLSVLADVPHGYIMTENYQNMAILVLHKNIPMYACVLW